ncbi:hypothetical protein [Streptomyces sp. F001]|uniref:hypothetical protein n=1 Tax=Streptomyces sp. F001 TaxID=1510026 RepID=UPI001F0D28C7|nr:hypothetical protein [Streptomyces sp. F001]
MFVAVVEDGGGAVRQTAHAHPATLREVPGFLLSTEYSWPSSSPLYGRSERRAALGARRLPTVGVSGLPGVGAAR